MPVVRGIDCLSDEPAFWYIARKTFVVAGKFVNRAQVRLFRKQGSKKRDGFCSQDHENSFASLRRNDVPS